MTSEEATEVLKELWRYEKTDKYTDSQIREALEKAIEALKDRPTGCWWVRNTYPQECECWDCSECKETVFEQTNYCPNCGAKMASPTGEKTCYKMCNRWKEKPKTGRWITQWNVAHQKEYYYCSECQEEYSHDGETGVKMNDYDFCPNCGAKME